MMENYWMYLLFVLGVVLIVKGGAVWIAEVTMIPQFIIGATIVRLATTLPEIIVSTIAALEGHSILTSAGQSGAVPFQSASRTTGDSYSLPPSSSATEPESSENPVLHLLRPDC